MIYITGDTHGTFDRFSRKSKFRQLTRPTGQDYVIVCGDLGLLWQKSAELDYNLKLMARHPFTLLWVQGNHENYDMIAEYPVEMWHGGKARHIVRDKVILLERGQIFQIEGKTFFTFGGASSHDVQGGILDPESPDYAMERRRAKRSRLPYRVRHISWWEQELPTEAEIQEARDNLGKVQYRVDYVISHCCSTRIQEEICRKYWLNNSYGTDILTSFFDELEERLEYKAWYFGHMHREIRVDEKHFLMYTNFERIPPNDGDQNGKEVCNEASIEYAESRKSQEIL